ncbi:transposase [Bacillus sp. S10(2024)]|uniref:transposase n=1 Tax=Bacillus sp. S10(2024) TaxID=3162886 RepID=UPI003D1FECFC
MDGTKIEANANKYSFVRKKVTDSYEELKAKAKQSLWSDEGSQIYAKRKTEVESAVSHIKGNWSFRQFSLRRLTRVTTEFRLVAIAHNFLKQAEKNRSFEEESLKNNKTIITI